jgi:hypothetical protein
MLPQPHHSPWVTITCNCSLLPPCQLQPWTSIYKLQKLCKELESLNKQRAELEQKVSQLAQSGGDLAALEAASTQLAAVADKADEAELQWLELAELAGDL